MSSIAGRVILVTGASTGIGAACVDKLIASGFFVFGSVRTEADAERLQIRYGSNFSPLIFDVTNDRDILQSVECVDRKLAGAKLAGLVNNAGMAAPGPLLHIPMSKFREQIAVNLTGQLQVIQAFAPCLGAGEQNRSGPPGRIVNMSSVAGRFAAPFLGAYSASKFGFEALSDALRRELYPFGVKLTVVQPGMIATTIWDKAEEVDFSPYEHTIYAAPAQRMREWIINKGRLAPSADKVANAVLYALVAKNPPTRIAVVQNSLIDYFLPPLLPTKLADWLVVRQMKLEDMNKSDSSLS